MNGKWKWKYYCFLMLFKSLVPMRLRISFQSIEIFLPQKLNSSCGFYFYSLRILHIVTRIFVYFTWKGNSCQDRKYVLTSSYLEKFCSAEIRHCGAKYSFFCNSLSTMFNFNLVLFCDPAVFFSIILFSIASHQKRSFLTLSKLRWQN